MKRDKDDAFAFVFDQSAQGLPLVDLDENTLTLHPGGGHSLLTARGLSMHCLESRLMTVHPGGGHLLLTPPTNTCSLSTTNDA